MSVTEEARKNSDVGRIKCHWMEKSFSKIYSILLFCIKSSSKSTFVQPRKQILQKTKSIGA